MDTVKFSEVSIFVVTLEVAIAVVSLFSLSVVFGVFALLALEEPFYTEEAKPLLIASTIFFISIYIILLFQLLTGFLLLKSLTLMKINLLGAVKTSWIWLITSVLTTSVLIYLIRLSIVDYGNYYLIPLLVYLVQKVLSMGFVLRFTLGACVIAVKRK